MSKPTAPTATPCVCVHDFAAAASARMTPAVRGYYNSGACGESTLHENCAAFTRLLLRPRCMRDVSRRSTDATVLGHRLRMPIAIAPTAMQRMAHPDGELATARAAGRAGTIYTMSTLATASIEQVAAAAPDAIKWFQLYIYKDRTLTERLVRRAEAAGFAAIVLTVDAPTFGVRRADLRNRFELPAGLELGNFEGCGRKSVVVRSDGTTGAGNESGISEYVDGQFDASLSWRDLRWLVAFTRLPVLVKGVLTAEDAREAVRCGARGVIVSNHGARQLDTVQATVSVYAAILLYLHDIRN